MYVGISCSKNENIQELTDVACRLIYVNVAALV